jgi:hypothetical protein
MLLILIEFQHPILIAFLSYFTSQGPGWSYETELPEWARVDWNENEWDF